jgi:TetR/AcrR family transcriptional repressor of nem operon
MPPQSMSSLTSKGQQTRQRIVAAAAQLMSDRGVAGTSVEHVRDAAGVSNSQIYHYFADKDALIREVIDYHSDSIVDIHEAVFATVDSIGGLRAWRDMIVKHQREMHCKGGCPIVALGSELAEIDPRARADVAACFVRWEQAIRVGYKAMRDKGLLAGGVDPEELATATLAALQGGLLLSQIRRTTQPLEIALDTILSYVATLTNPPGLSD